MNHLTHFDTSKFQEQIELAHTTGLPLLICLVATKACYIKFSGLVQALASDGFPFLAIESGQHYEDHLTGAADELDFRHHLSGSFHMRGSLTDKSAAMFTSLSSLSETLTKMGFVGAPLLVTCGDTLSAGVSPFAWYLLTGYRSVHLEAGLRSMRPKWEWCQDLLDQRLMPWISVPTRPFPEGLCTRFATCASQSLMAPVQRNVDNLLREAYDPQSIHLTGSPSVDALKLAMEQAVPESGKRIRVDIHRRENLNRSRLEAIFSGLCQLRSLGIPIEFVITNSMKVCEGKSWDKDDIKTLELNGVETSAQWTSYVRVVSFLVSPDCLGVYTDSGGLQEECCILGVPCMTCRYDTDRPETVLDFKTNILIPPKDADYISASIYRCLTSSPETIWSGLGHSRLSYGSNVGDCVVHYLRSSTLEPPTSNMLG